MAEIICVISQKGGTGKTTLVRTLSDALRQAGLRLLAVDLDPQANLSDYFDVPAGTAPDVGAVLLGEASPQDAIHNGVIPANLGLAAAEARLATQPGSDTRLRDALEPLRDRYDLILLDCPPALGLLTVNAMLAATQVLLCTAPQYFAMSGVEQALEFVELTRERANPALALLGIIVSIADLRTRHAREAVAALREFYGDQVFTTMIRASIAYSESAELGVSILEHRRALGTDYLNLAVELLTRLGQDTAARRIARQLEKH